MLSPCNWEDKSDIESKYLINYPLRDNNSSLNYETQDAYSNCLLMNSLVAESRKQRSNSKKNPSRRIKSGKSMEYMFLSI